MGVVISDLILLIDDEAAIRHTCCRILDRLGWQVEALSSGVEALSSIRSGLKPQLIIVDSVMPGMNGEETARAIWELLPDVSMVLSSGNGAHVSDPVVEKKLSGFLAKPYSVNQVKELLQKLAN